MKVKCKVWIETDDGKPIISEGKYKLLRDIEKTHSVKLSVQNLGLTYKKAHSQIKTIEKRLGKKILERKKGVGSILNQEGKKLLRIYELAFDSVQRACNVQIDKISRETVE